MEFEINRPGLTAQCPLDEFWESPQPVNPGSVSAFAAFLKATCQANGSFYAGYRRTGVLDTVIARMADQYEFAISAPALARTRDLPVRITAARKKSGRDVAPRRLISTGAGEGAE